MRSLHELVFPDESAWPNVLDWIEDASNSIEILPIASTSERDEGLLATQVTTKSAMGAIIYESGGILVDHGWIRILGSGHKRLPRSLPAWNADVEKKVEDGPPPFLLVADDVVGGFFAIDGGEFGQPGIVFYLSPDSLYWECTHKTYSDFIYFCFHGDLEKFYTSMRWPGWETEIEPIDGSSGVCIFPFPWALGPPIAERHRSIVPMTELYLCNAIVTPEQLGIRPYSISMPEG